MIKPLKMKQGTKSILFGCHSIVHSLLVIWAWKILYGKWPKRWQVACIFLHDIGHIGLQYLDDYEAKKQHWRKGAEIAYKFYGDKGYLLVAGHAVHSKFIKSDLYKADKYSWYIAPMWWLIWNNMVEPELMINCKSNIDACRKFKALVKQSIESGEYISTHQMYLDRVSGR